jgi:hypothetical protein
MGSFRLGFDLFINTHVVRLIDPGTTTSCNGMVHRVPPEVILLVKEMLFSSHVSFIQNSGNWFYFPSYTPRAVLATMAARTIS